MSHPACPPCSSALTRAAQAGFITLVVVSAAGCPSGTPANAKLPSPPMRVAPDEPTVASVLGVRGRVAIAKATDAAFGRLSSDGVGRLTCDSLDVNVTVDGRMARTQVTQVFRNQTPRQLEGTYTFTLPAEASIARLAMDVNGKMMEGELVEKEKARQIFESIVRKKKDPALLEWEGGNRFKTRIFPIPAKGTKTVVLTYEQLLPQQGRNVRYRYTLPALVNEKDPERIGKLTFSLQARRALSAKVTGYPAKVAGAAPLTITHAADAFVPDGPLEVDLVGAGAESVAHVANKGLAAADGGGEARAFLVDWVPGIDAAQLPPGDLVIALDTSASVGSVELIHAVRLAATLIERTDPGRKALVAYGDVQPLLCATEPAAAGPDGAAAFEPCLRGLAAQGASDLSALLGLAVHAASKLDDPRVVLLSDGVPSLGEVDVDLLAAKTGASAKDAGVRVHTVAIGHAPDEELLRAVARAGGGHAVRMSPSDAAAATAETLHYLLGAPLVEDVTVDVVEGHVTDLVLPPASVARGEPALLLGRLTGEFAKLTYRATYQGRAITRDVMLTRKDAYDDPMLVRFWARGHIGEMVRHKEKREDIVAASVKYGVMSPYTSFLVLETEQMYAQNQIARRKKEEEAQAEQARRQAKQQPQGFRKGSGPLQDLLGEGGRAKRDKNNMLGLQGRGKAKDTMPRPSSRGGAPELESASDDGAAPEAAVPQADPTDADAPAKRPGRAERRPAPKTEAPKEMAKKKSSRRRTKEKPRIVSGLGNPTVNSVIGRRGPALKPNDGRRSTTRSPTVGIERVRGTGASDEVRRVVASNLGGVTACLRRPDGKFPSDLDGGIEILLWLDASTPTQVRAQFAGNVPPARSCVQSVARRWRFDRVGRARFRVSLSVHGSLEPDELMLGGRVVTWKSAYARRKALSDDDLRTLYNHFLFTSPTKGKVLAKLLIQRRKSEPARGLLDDLFGTMQARASMSDLHFQLVVRALKEGSATPSDLLEVQLDDKRAKALAKTAIAHAKRPAIARAVLTVLPMQVRERDGLALLTAWEESGAFSRRQMLEVLWPRIYSNSQGIAARTFDIAAEVLASREADSIAADIVVQLGASLGRSGAALAALQEACVSGRLGGAQCLERLGEDPATPPADRLLYILLARREAMDDVALIERAVKALEEMGAKRDAARVLSEMVEFSPRDAERRRTYFTALRQRGEPIAACAQGAALVQLEPKERDMFRTMMDLARNAPTVAPEVRTCITEGVSMLPVRRSVSVVMTWEDDTADIDLHIKEPEGEDVNFARRESKHGGLLYYDVRNGLGPEIYTLGEAPKGKVRVGVVYYKGDAKDVKVTVTVMRNAGAPDETREVFDVTLGEQAPERVEWLTDFHL